MTQPGSVRVRHSRTAFLAHLAPFSRPQRISSIWWNKVNSDGSSNADAHWGTSSTLWELHSACWATLSHEPPPIWSGMGQEVTRVCNKFLRRDTKATGPGLLSRWLQQTLQVFSRPRSFPSPPCHPLDPSPVAVTGVVQTQCPQASWKIPKRVE